MDAFAWISIFEALGKLAVAFAIMVSPIDKLVFYAAMLALVSLLTRMVYGLFCKRNFEETRSGCRLDRGIFKEMFSFAGWNFFTVAFIALMILFTGFQNIAGGLVYPMTADCTDYEVYRSGKYVPGLIGTVFSFIDKLISSLAPLLVGLMCAAVSSSSELPTADTPYSKGLAVVGVFCMFGIVLLGYVCNIISMHFYPLTKERMDEIAEDIARIKRESCETVEVCEIDGGDREKNTKSVS